MTKRCFSFALLAVLSLMAVGCATQPYSAGQVEQKPLEVALAFWHDKLPDGNAEGRQTTTILQERAPCPENSASACLNRAMISLVIEGVEDDSIRAERYQVLLELASDQPWGIIEQQADWACRSGRGHTGFSTDLCR